MICLKLFSINSPQSSFLLDVELRTSHLVLRSLGYKQGCRLGFFEAKFVLAFFQLLWPFLFLKKGQMLAFFAFFGHLDFLYRFGRFTDYFGRFLGTSQFLDTVVSVSGQRMINFHWKLCTKVYNFLFCCLMLTNLQFQVALQQNQKFREVH